MKKSEQVNKSAGLAFDPSRDKVLNLPNYLEHPFFKKKAEESKKVVEKYDLLGQIKRLRSEG